MPTLDRVGFHAATPQGAGAIAVFDLYGDESANLLRSILRSRKGVPLSPVRMAALASGESVVLGDLVDETGESIDEVVVSRVEAGANWCRREALRLSVHGGPWVQSRVVELLRSKGAVALDTRGVLLLALASGAIDAYEASAFERLIDARTEKAARFFARQHSGELSRRVARCLHELRSGSAAHALGGIEELLRAYPSALRLSEPLRVLIAGRPNAGKSTLFNRLAEEERSAVTPIAGTTRDLNEALVAIAEFPVIFIDSAGLRQDEALDPVEREGIRRVESVDAHAVVYLVPPPWKLEREEEAFLARRLPQSSLLVASFADTFLPHDSPAGWLSVSGLTGKGVDALRLELVSRWIASPRELEGDPPCAAFTREQASCFTRAAEALRADPVGLDAAENALVQSATAF